MRRTLAAVVIGVAALGLAGCNALFGIDELDDGGGENDGGVPPMPAVYELSREVDLLFVIDNSGTMFDEQVNLATQIPNFVGALEAMLAGVPDLHIGVVSTDMGALASVPQCGASGDNAQLQAFGDGTCTTPADPYIIDIQTATGRETNYIDSLDATLSCISRLGIQGCGFESPLEAAQLAVDPVAAINPGFLREDALLAVVFLTDEDDCSVTDRLGFYADPNGSPQLGLLNSFRCFEFGVVCEPDEPREFGNKSGCVPREDSQFLTPVASFVDFFSNLKGNGRFVATSIQGPAMRSGAGFNAQVAAIMDGGVADGTPELSPSCTSAAGEAVPGIRLQSFVDAFATGRGSSICDNNFRLDVIVGELAEALSVRCIPPGVAVPRECEVDRIDPQGFVEGVPECQSSAETGCYELLPDEINVCGGTPAVKYFQGVSEPLGQRIEFRCDGDAPQPQ